MMNFINPRRRMKESLVFLIFAVAGSCAGIFWTNSKDNDYPRIGRRSFYTSSSENTYPRIGRSGAVLKNSFPDLERRSSFFTHSDENTFPRIGRGDYRKSTREDSVGGGVSQTDAGKSGPTDTPFPSSVEDSSPQKQQQQDLALPQAFNLPAPILFFAWDVDGDDSLSRDEFINGIANSRKRRRLV